MTESATQSTENATWYYQLLGLPTGPVDRDRVAWLVENGHLVAASTVGPGPDGPWQRLDESPLSDLLPVSESTEEKVSSDTDAGDTSDAPTVTTKAAVTKAMPAAPAETGEVITDGIEIDEPPNRPAPAAEPETETGSDRGSDDFELADYDDEEQADGARLQLTPLPPVNDSAAVAASDADARTARERKSAPKRRTREKAKATEKSPRERLVRVAAVAVVVILALMLARVFFGGETGEEAHATFTSTYEAFQTNRRAMSDPQWFDFINAANQQVETALEPIRKSAGADRPKLQALMWAGEELLLILRGSRELTEERKARFEAFMAEYADEAPPRPAAPAEEKVEGFPGERPRDPMFQ